MRSVLHGRKVRVLPHPNEIKSMDDLLCIIRGGHTEAAAGGGGYSDYSDDDEQPFYYQQQNGGPGSHQYADIQSHPGYVSSNINQNIGGGQPQHQQQQLNRRQNPNDYYGQHSDNHMGYSDEPYTPINEPTLPGEPPLPEANEPPLPDGPYVDSPYHHHTSHSQRGQIQRRPPPQSAQTRQPYQTSPQPQQSPTTTGAPELELESFNKDLIFAGLKRMYRKKILPLELSSKYGHFHSPPLSPSDFEAKPMVLLLGQYSVGKTSFIRYLLGRDFPGIRIGPEPTTDRFNCIMHGDVDKIIPGAALCSQADRPFRGLSPFGNNFLSKFEGVEMDAPILHNITLVDTPGILSGVKQSVGRNYDYDAVMKWFAERADLIIIMFDAHKLDISDELKRVIELMKPHADKVRVVLNKADSISTQQLMRVYGALMWQLGKVMNTPEVCRVYISSFWGAPLKNREQATLLTQEKLDLFSDIAQLPQNAVMRRINELVKRARSVKVHAYIIHYLRKQLPYTFGKREKQARLINRLDRELVMCARRYELPRGDFPPIEPLRQALLEIKDLSEFPKLDKRMVKDMDKVFSVDIPELLERARGD